MTAQRFQKLPVEIEAMHFRADLTPAEAHDIYRWIENNTAGSFEPLEVIEGRAPYPASGVSIDPRDGRMIISTLEGLHWVDLGDWVIRGIKGEFYPCRPDIFDATYRAVGLAQGVDIDIYEPVPTDRLEGVNRLGVIAPRRLRLNGQEVLWPTGHPPVIHEIKFGDPDAAIVTLTLFARQVQIHAEAE